MFMVQVFYAFVFPVERVKSQKDHKMGETPERKWWAGGGKRRCPLVRVGLCPIFVVGAQVDAAAAAGAFGAVDRSFF